MAWDHLSITKPHLVYIILGGFTSIFMLCSSVIKERMYIGEATVATLCGLIFGPHAANLINPREWGSVDIVTIEFSRIVLVVQCFAVGVELPKFYMERHWKSVVFLLVPVMTFGWLVTSLFVWWMVPVLSWLDSLVIAACVTATDPVLASSVVGKGKFAKRVPRHLRDLLSAESGCNDGMAFPFIYLSLYLIEDHLDAGKVTFHWVVYTILYECIFGAIYGFLIGYFARHGIKYAEKHDLIDRESFLVFYFTLALFCAGSGSILGVDDLLVGFSAGVGFSNDGWFGQKTEESHVSNVIDLLLNLAYFVFLGTIIPWEMFNDASLGLSAWRLAVVAVFVILFRRIPIMMALKPFIPDIKTWREALFAGHFGPIGVGAIFIALLARAELESGDPVPLAELPPADTPHFTLITLVWPITTFLVVASILVHGSSIAVFTLGKHINTLTLTMSYTTAPEDGPSWMNRLPRISSQSRSQARTMSDTDIDEKRMPKLPPGTLPPIGFPGNFLRRVKDDDGDHTNSHGVRASTLSGRRRQMQWDDGIGPGGPVSQSAIFPQHHQPWSEHNAESSSNRPVREPSPGHQDGTSDVTAGAQKHRGRQSRSDALERQASGRAQVEIYDEGGHIIVEDRDGEVLAVESASSEARSSEVSEADAGLEASTPKWTYDTLKKRMGGWLDEEVEKRTGAQKTSRRHAPARAYHFGNTVIIEDDDGEVVKTYELPARRQGKDGSHHKAQGLRGTGMGPVAKDAAKGDGMAPSASEAGQSSNGDSPAPKRTGTFQGWMGLKRSAGPEAEGARKENSSEDLEDEDDRHIRFTIGGVGQRMTKGDFIREMQKLDQNTKRDVVDLLTASQSVKALAKQAGLTDGTLWTRKSSKPKDERPVQGRLDSVHRDSTFQDSDRNDGQGASGDVHGQTAVERRRQLAVSKTISGTSKGRLDESDEAAETPAERRRREAALGIGVQDGGEGAKDDDSDDDNTARVPPARRGIRFADILESSNRRT